MKAYSYSDKTKEYVGEVECQLDPLETEKTGEEVWLLPANSTWLVPPEKVDGKAIVFLNGEWAYMPDYRGQEYFYLEDGIWQSGRWKKLGNLPDGIVLEIPEYVPTEEQKWEALRRLRNYKLNLMDAKVAQLERAMRQATEELQRSAYEEALGAWDSYANALCQLPEQEGAPWDGGGENTPWPVEPAMPAIEY